MVVTMSVELCNLTECVNTYFTHFSSESDGTDAAETVDLIDAFTAVHAGVAGAVVDIRVTVASRVSGHAGAVVVVDEVDASSSVLALAYAVVDVQVTVLAGPTFLALTPVISYHVLTGVRVDARIVFTFVYV